MYAGALMVGATVGIGFLGIPYTFAKSGTGVGALFLLVLAMILMVGNLIYGEVILRTHSRHQFIGYVRTYLGPVAKTIGLFSFWLSLYGGLIASILVNSSLSSKILSLFGYSVSARVLGVIFFVVALGLVMRGIKSLSRVDVVVFGCIAVIVVLLLFSGLSQLRLSNYIFSTGRHWFLPFGVIIFSLSGIQGIPLARELMTGEERKLKKAIIGGTLAPTFFYLFFALMIVGLTGTATSPESIIGLQSVLGRWVVLIGSLLGFLTSSTIFLSIASAFRESLAEDFKFKEKWQFTLFVTPALVFFIIGVVDFIDMIGLVGSVAMSIDMVLLMFVYVKAKEKGERIPEYSLRLPNSLIYSFVAIFIGVIVYSALIK